MPQRRGAIQALKFGAFDYLQKPFKVDELMQALKRSLRIQWHAIVEARDVGRGSRRSRPGEFEARPGLGRARKSSRSSPRLKNSPRPTPRVADFREVAPVTSCEAKLLHAPAAHGTAPMVRIDCG